MLVDIQAEVYVWEKNPEFACPLVTQEANDSNPVGRGSELCRTTKIFFGLPGPVLHLYGLRAYFWLQWESWETADTSAD